MHATSRPGGARLSLVGAVALANLADGIVRLALPLIVLSAGATPSQAALVMSAGVAPWFVASLPVGAALDRVRPERWARRANPTRAVLLSALAIAASYEPPTALWPAIALCLGTAEVVADLAAQTLVPPNQPLHDLKTGLGYFRSRRDLLALAGIVGALDITEEITRSTLPAFALNRAPLHLSETSLGFLVGLGGLGGLAGAVLAPYAARRLGANRLVALAMPTIPATPLALTLAPTPLVVGAAIAASSAAVPLCAVAIVTHRQRTTPTDLLGRTNATFQTIGLGAATLGGTLAALSIGLTSYRATFAIATLISAAAILTLRPARALNTA